MKYLIDSNIFIYAAAGVSEALCTLDEASSADFGGYSAITRLEVLGYKHFTENEEHKLLGMLSCFTEYDVSCQVIDESVNPSSTV